MVINGQEVIGNHFAYDGCHKIYILESDSELQDCDYPQIRPIKDLPEVWEDSCGLRFISNWSLEKSYVNQFEDADFNERA